MCAAGIKPAVPNSENRPAHHRMFRYLPRNMNGIIAVEKPSGITSSKVVLQLSAIFNSSDVFAADLSKMRQKVHDELTAGTRWSESKIANRVRKAKVKTGHGGTLDPLASGVLIIGIGSGTKQLSHYLGECTKTYETRAVLGQSTTTGDSEGEVVMQTEVADITLEKLRKTAAKFVGSCKQTPPIYSALKVDGKPLYEYAREGIPVPKPIQARDVKVHSFDVHDDFGPHESYGYLEFDASTDSLTKALFNNPTLNDHDLSYSEEFMSNPDISDEEKVTSIQPKLIDPSQSIEGRPPVFHATASVGSGTYIRSLLSDLGRAVGSSAFMAELIRSKQGNWELGKNVFKYTDFTDRDERVWGPVLKRVLETGHEVDVASEFAKVEAAILPLIEKEKEAQSGETEVVAQAAEEVQREDDQVKRRKVETEEA